MNQKRVADIVGSRGRIDCLITTTLVEVSSRGVDRSDIGVKALKTLNANKIKFHS